MENITTLPSFRRSQKGRKSGDGAPKRNGDKMESEEGKDGTHADENTAGGIHAADGNG